MCFVQGIRGSVNAGVDSGGFRRLSMVILRYLIPDFVFETRSHNVLSAYKCLHHQAWFSDASSMCFFLTVAMLGGLWI
jgi:hypothetical protein